MPAWNVPGDPHWISARFAGECRKCGTAISTGDRVWFWPKARGNKVECLTCGEASERRFIAEVQDEISSGGWS